MKKILLCLLVAIAVVGCNKPEAQDDDSKSAPPPVTKATPAIVKAASPTPASNDWMWKTSKGKPRDNDPFKVPADPFEKKK